MDCKHCNLLPCYYTWESFSDYKVGDWHTIKIGNSIHFNIVGICNVCFETNVGCKLTLKYVKHVIGLCLHMLLVLLWKLNKGALVVAKGDTLYKTKEKVHNNEVYAVEGASLDLW